MPGLVQSILTIGAKIAGTLSGKNLQLAEKNLEINAEMEKNSGGKMTPRKLLMYMLCLVFAFEVFVRPLLVTYWPELTLPPSMIENISVLISAAFGLGF